MSTLVCLLLILTAFQQDTWAFMNRRLSDVHSIAKCARNADNVTKDIRNVVKAGLLTVTVTIS